MIFYVLIGIIFLAELIISIALIIHLLKWQSKFKETANFINEVMPKIKDISETIRKISEQMTELSPIIVDKVKNIIFKIIKDNLQNAILGSLIWFVKRSIKIKKRSV